MKLNEIYDALHLSKKVFYKGHDGSEKHVFLNTNRAFVFEYIKPFIIKKPSSYISDGFRTCIVSNDVAHGMSYDEWIDTYDRKRFNEKFCECDFYIKRL